jgi:hypothetical protein
LLLVGNWARENRSCTKNYIINPILRSLGIRNGNNSRILYTPPSME